MVGSTSVYTRTFLTLGFLLTVADTAQAGEDSVEREITIRRSVEVLAHMDRPEVETTVPDRSWFISNIHIKKKRGLEYTHVMSYNDRPLLLNVQGPVMRKRRLGVTLELRF